MVEMIHSGHSYDAGNLGRGLGEGFRVIVASGGNNNTPLGMSVGYSVINNQARSNKRPGIGDDIRTVVGSINNGCGPC